MKSERLLCDSESGMIEQERNGNIKEGGTGALYLQRTRGVCLWYRDGFPYRPEEHGPRTCTARYMDGLG